MRILLMTVLAGSALVLGACQTTGVQSAELGDANHYVVSGGQSRNTVDVPRHEVVDVRTDAPYSMTGTDVHVEAPMHPAHAVNTSSFVRHATNGN